MEGNDNLSPTAKTTSPDYPSVNLPALITPENCEMGLQSENEVVLPGAVSAIRKNAAKKKPIRTLAIDIGGTGIKMLILDERGRPLTDRSRILTPQPATPKAVVGAIRTLARQQKSFDRVSAGFPGVVKDGVVFTAPNLAPQWKNIELSKILRQELHRPVRVANDADVQGFGVIRGKGVEMVITLGTGVGSALFVDGKLVPNLELGHHPFLKGKTYEQKLGRKALEKCGKRKWNKRLQEAITELQLIFNYHMLYIGGGNTKYVRFKLPPHVKLVSNQAGLWGGIALWQEYKG